MTGWIAKKRTARSAKRLLPVALLTLLVSGAVTAWVALAANTPPPAPTISAGPANPTNQTSATFTYTDSQAVTKFQCSLDGAAFADCGTARPSSKTYSGLAAGSHTFQVRAFVQQGNLTSSPTSYSWVVDLTAPTVISINRAGANPTNAASVSWTVTFSESVTSVAIANFSLVASGLSGSPAVTAVSGSGTTWSVSASTGTGTPSGSGSLQLRLSSVGAIKDVAGNALGGSLPVNGQTYTIDKTSPAVPAAITSGPSGLVNSSSATFAFSGEAAATFQCALESPASPVACSSPTTYTGLTNGGHTFYVRQVDAAGNVGTAFASRSWTIDTVPPPAPVFTNKPDDPNGDGLADFSWTDAESPVTYKCSLENGAFSSCTSPFHTILNISNSGQHQFAVRAYDVAGNFSETAYIWKVDVSMRFTITGNAVGLLAPGGGWRDIDVLLHNPNNFPINVDQLQIAVGGAGSCPVSPNLDVRQPGTAHDTAMSPPVTVPGNGNAHVPVSQRPQLQLLNTDSNQDACKNVTFTLTYAGHATK